MVKSIYSPENCLEYLQSYAVKETFTIGLIIGQSTNVRDNVILLTRTPEDKCSETASELSLKESVSSTTSLIELSEGWIADHAKHVTRMLPGGIFVRGIFIIFGEQNIFEQANCCNKIKSIINHIHKILSADFFMFGNCPQSTEKYVLHMTADCKTITCKSIEVGTGNKNAVFKHVEWKFIPTQHWQRLDCYYEFDEVYPVIVKKSGISVKQQFQQILEAAHKMIESSVMFIDGELNNKDDVLDQLNKKKKQPKSVKAESQEAPKPMQVSLFVPFETHLPETVEYLECEGSIHFSGVVASSVFMYPKATVGEAIDAVKQDIVRSLASRFTMHCDALIDDNLLPEEKACFNEPPRRVLVPAGGGVWLCDYLFPGEAAAEAPLSVRELLDLHIAEQDVVADLETPADTSEFDALDRDSSSEEMLTTPQEASQLMYITGICFAMLVLVVSIFVHYYQDIIHVVGELMRRGSK